MSFLAPWALLVGGLAAAGAVILHLVARQRPAAYMLPTTRFIPDRRTLVSRIARRPRDLLLLALRVLLLTSAAAAFARPVLAPNRVPLGRLVVIDRSGAVARPDEVLGRARVLVSDGVAARVIAFDSAATLLSDDVGAALDSLARDSARTASAGSVSAALVAARRSASLVAGLADSVELVLVSPLADGELDAATDSVRGRWPGRITIARGRSRVDSTPPWRLERTLGAEDPLGPALADVPVSANSTAVRLRRAALDARDSAFVRGGGAVVQWDTASASPLRPTAIAMGDDVVVAALGRGVTTSIGRVIARWSDGTAAAREELLGAGCVRHVAIGLPVAGDLPLRPDFKRVVRGLMAPCGSAHDATPADSASVARLAGRGALARGDALTDHARRTSPLAPWLLGLALACALAELALRARPEPEAS
jgi:hypothetical protein